MYNTAEEGRIKMENPFCYGEAVGDAFFMNREKEIEELKSEFRSSQNIIIFSPRRYGKTSLIKKVLFDLEKEGFIVVYIDLFWATSKEKFIELYAKALAKNFRSKIKTALSSIKSLLPRLVSKVIVTSDGSLDFEFSFDIRKEEVPILEDLYEAVHKVASVKKKKAVVVFDEFQEILALKDEGIERQMRSHFQFHRNVAYVFLGSKTHLLQKLFANSKRAFYGSGRFYPLRKIPQEQFFAWIKERFARTGLRIEDTQVDRILELTTSHPYYTQQLCHFIWERTHNQSEVTALDIENSLEEILASQSANYVNIWDLLNANQRNFLMALTIEPEVNIFAKEFLTKYNLGMPSHIQRIISSLIEKQILLKENDKVVFADVFLPIWIRKKQAQIF